MIKINVNNYKFTVLVASLFSAVLAFLVLREFLLSPGVVESIDIQWNNYPTMFEMFFHTWNFYTNGSNIVFVSQFPLYSLVLVIKDVAVAQRLVYFLIVSLVSFNMFLVAFFSLKRVGENHVFAYLGSIVASFFYTINPLMFSEIFHISFLWSYSLFPLVYFFTLRSLNASSRQNVLVSALLLSAFFAFMTDAWGMVVAVLLFLVVAFSSIVLNGRKSGFRLSVSNFLLTLLVMALVIPLLAAYWLLPFMMQKPSQPVWDSFSVTNLFRNSQDNNLHNTLGLHAWSSQPFFNLSGANATFYPVWLCSTFIVPIMVVSAILLRKDKMTLTLSALLIVSAFLAKGVQPPIGEFYLWLSFYSPKIIPNQTFLLKYPYVFIANISLAYALLSAVLVVELFGRPRLRRLFWKHSSVKSHGRPIALLFSIMTLIALAGAPMLTGNLNGALTPVSLPQQYKELNQLLSSQEGTFRVMWLPQASGFVWSPNPYANKIEYWGSAVPPLLYGWGVSPSPYTGFLGNMVYDYLSNNRTLYLGKILALANVKYVVFHNDTADYACYQSMLDNLLVQKDLKLIFSKENLFAFENTYIPDYFRALKKVNLVVGGLDTLASLSSLSDFYPDESAFLFLERQHTSKSTLTSILTSTDLDKTLLFYGNKTFDDLLLDTIDAETLIAPSERFIATSPMSGWFKDTVTSHLWTPITLSEYAGEKYDLSLDRPILYTSSTGANLSFSIQVDKSADYDVWIRLLFNPEGGKLSLSIGDVGFLKEVDTFSPVLTAFKWAHLGEVYLNAGSHEIGIINENGFNVVNLIGLPTVDSLEGHRDDLLNLINKSNATIAYIVDKPLLDSTKTIENSCEITMYAPQTSPFTISAMINPDLKGEVLNVSVDGQNLTVDSHSSSNDPNWYSIGSISLNQGSHILKFSALSPVEIEKVIMYSTGQLTNTVESLKSVFGNGIVPYIVDYEKSGSVTFSVTINASKAFILAFQEPYDEFWQSNTSATKMIVNSVVNGFFVKDGIDTPKNELYSINIDYTPETYFQLGTVVSALALVFTLIICVIIVSPKLGKKKAIFS